MHERTTGKIDRNPSWWINIETGAHICFSCHYKGNLLQLICDVNEYYLALSGLTVYDYSQAREWLSNISEISVEVLLERLRSMPVFITAPPKLLPMSEARLAIYTQPPAEQLAIRNLTSDSAKTYGVMWDAVRNYWILPFRDATTNGLLGWQEKGVGENRYFRNRPAGLAKSKTLFGIENQNDSMVIVVESPLDCLRIQSAGLVGTVAICGSSPSQEQVKLLRGSEKIIVALDNDKAGQKGNKEFLDWSRKYGLNLFFFDYGSSNAKDPGEMSNEEIHLGIRHAKSAIYGESAYVQGNTQTLSS
jgi:hypothetical protein